ncbi:hypothetical protein STEG23_031389, partial [Scotinomys teguina]
MNMAEQTSEWEHCSQEQDDKEGVLLVNLPKHQGFHCDPQQPGEHWEVDRTVSDVFKYMCRIDWFKFKAPLWAYIACACGLFIYQSLDAIDGKQARRTNSSSPLGELFDHGCDSLSTVFVVLGTCIAVQLGTNPDWMFFCCFAGTFMFYCAHWQTYVSGTLRFGIFDVTESQIIIILCQLLSGTLGPWFWNFT